MAASNNSRTAAMPPGSVSGDSQDFSDAYTDELIERILENYVFKCEPEIRFKLKRKLPDLALCACYSKPWHQQPRWRFTLKPTRTDGPVSQYVRSLLVLPEAGQACVFSKKISLNVFRLQFILGYNWKTRTPSLDYSLTTKWGDGPRSMKRKEQAQVSQHFEVRTKWNMDVHLPDLEGHLGGSGNNNTAVDVDYGGLTFEIAQIDGVLEI